MKEIFLCENADKVADVYVDCTKVYSKKELISSGIQDAEVIFSTWGMPKFSEEEIKQYLPNLKAVFYAAGSVQDFAKPFFNCGVKIFSAWQANAIPVAEYTVSQILLANKGFYLAARTFNKSSKKKAKAIARHYCGNYNAKIGILGYGAIGSLVTKELLRHKLDVYVFAPNLTQEEADKLGIHKTSLEYIFENCNVISNHIANLPQTVGIINKNLLKKMNDYTTFINTGRGAQVDEKALIKILLHNRTISAILDVTKPEPPSLFSPLRFLRNVYLTPHIAGSTGKEVQRMAEYMKNAYEMFKRGENCHYEVTMAMLETMA